MNCDFSRIRDDLVVVIDVGGAKIDDDINDEHNVNDEINYFERL